MKKIIAILTLLFSINAYAEQTWNPEKVLSYTVSWDHPVDDNPAKNAAITKTIIETSTDLGVNWTPIDAPFPDTSYIFLTAPFGETTVWHRLRTFGTGYPVSAPTHVEVVILAIPKPFKTPLLYPPTPN